MLLWEYVSKHSERGSCQCGKCIDAPEVPHQPSDHHTADVVFFKVAKREDADPQEFLKLVRTEFPHWLDGSEHSFIEMGVDIGDQGLALQAMGLGELLEVWELITPKTLLPTFPPEFLMDLAGRGLITIKTT